MTTRMTMDAALEGIASLPGLRIRAALRLSPGANYGLIISERPDCPGVLGLGAIDRDGDSTAIGLNPEEAATLRDELTAWLEELPGDHTPVPDPWLDPDAASANQPPPF